MKINDEFSLQSVGDIYLLVPLQTETFQKDRIFPTNEIGAYLWHILENECTEEELLNALDREYDIDRETALKDIRNFLNTLKSIGALSQ